MTYLSHHSVEPCYTPVSNWIFVFSSICKCTSGIEFVFTISDRFDNFVSFDVSTYSFSLLCKLGPFISPFWSNLLLLSSNSLFSSISFASFSSLSSRSFFSACCFDLSFLFASAARISFSLQRDTIY